MNKALAWSRLLTLGTASPDASDFASLTEAASMVAYLSGPYMQASANKCGLARAIEMRQRQVLGKGAPKSSLLGVLDPIDRSTRQCLEQDRQRLYGFFSSRFLENDVQTRALKSLHGTLWSASCAMCTELVRADGSHQRTKTDLRTLLNHQKNKLKLRTPSQPERPVT